MISHIQFVSVYYYLGGNIGVGIDERGWLQGTQDVLRRVAFCFWIWIAFISVGLHNQ